MRIRIRHETRYRYATPARGLAEVLRVTPRSFAGQYVAAWRVDLSADVAAPVKEDAFGNLAQTVFVPGPVSEFAVEVAGEVETVDTQGVVSGLAEPLPADLFLRSTHLTTPSRGFEAFVRDAAAGADDLLSKLHALMGAVHAGVGFVPDPGGQAAPLAEAFERGWGPCHDHAHLFVAGARLLGAPARYVSGHLVKVDEDIQQDATHAWAEAFVAGLGWVGFDTASGVCPGEAHVRVAAAFDALGAAPVRGVRLGGGAEAMNVAVEVMDLGQAERQISS